MQSFLSRTAESRLINFKVVENVGNVAHDTFDRYIRTPVESGHLERLLPGIPLAIMNGTFRTIDAVLAGGVADQSLDVPDGTFGETGRDLKLAGSHLLPLRPLKLATDMIRLPGTLSTGFLDAAAGFDTRHGIARTLNV